MKPSQFEYHEPEVVGEAVGLLDEHRSDAKVLAGGQSLVPMLNLRLAAFEHLVDINRVVGLDQIERRNGHLHVGAQVRQSVAEHDATLQADAPLVAAALPLIGHFQIRNRGTIGGSIAHADPASELPAVALALDATMEVASSAGSREVPAAEFFETTWETTLDDHELLTGLRLPVWTGQTGHAVEEVARRHGDFALVGAAVAVELDGDSVVRAGIGLFGVGSTPIRASEAEAALITGGAGADLVEIGNAAAAPLDPGDDVHASGAYRKSVAAVVVRRALTRAIEEARG